MRRDLDQCCERMCEVASRVCSAMTRRRPHLYDDAESAAYADIASFFARHSQRPKKPEKFASTIAFRATSRVLRDERDQSQRCATFSLTSADGAIDQLSLRSRRYRTYVAELTEELMARANLTHGEQLSIQMKYQLGSHDSRNELAAELGVSPQRVSQLTKSAERKLEEAAQEYRNED